MSKLFIITSMLFSFLSNKNLDPSMISDSYNMSALSWGSIYDYLKGNSRSDSNDDSSSEEPPVEQPVEEPPVEEPIVLSQFSLDLPKSQWSKDIIKKASGLKDENFNERQIHERNKVTGKTYNVVDYGADPNDNSSDDRQAIENLIAQAKAGDEIYFPNGVYNLKSTSSKSSSYHFYLKSGVNFRGESQDGVKLKSYYDDGGSGSFAIIQGYNVNNIHIKNMTLTSTWSGNYSSNPNTNNPDRGGPTYGMIVKGAKGSSDSFNLYIENVTVEKFRRVGISIANGARDVVIDGCFAQKATDVGGGGAGYGFVFQGAGHKSSVGDGQNPYYKKPGYDNYFNVLKNSKAFGPYIRHGIIIQYYSHNNLVENNQFYNTAYGAIDLHGEDEYGIEVKANECYKIGYSAGKKAGCIELGNTGSNHDASGPLNYIHSNLIRNSGYGVRVELSSSYTLIENNNFQDNKDFSDTAGVLLGKADSIVVQNNNFVNNTASSYSGVRLVENKTVNDSPSGSPKNCTIKDNTFSGNNGPNVRVDDEDGGNLIED